MSEHLEEARKEWLKARSLAPGGAEGALTKAMDNLLKHLEKQGEEKK